jgi:hypothetical protein
LRRQHCEHTVNDIDEIRAKLRDGQSTAAPSTGGRFGLLVLAACAAAFGAVLLVPRFLSPPAPVLVPLQPSAAIPTFKRVGEGAADTPAPRPQNMPNIVANYEGKSAIEIGKTADEVCFRRAQVRYPHESRAPRLRTGDMFAYGDMDHFNELVQCLLTEGMRRYCSGSQRRTITAEIVTYFRGIERGNLVLKAVRDKADEPPRDAAGRRFRETRRELDPDYIRSFKENFADIEPNRSVIAAIEARLRDGLLTKANRDEIAAAAPPQIRERFARIDPPKSNCPDEPWWAFWR